MFFPGSNISIDSDWNRNLSYIPKIKHSDIDSIAENATKAPGDSVTKAYRFFNDGYVHQLRGKQGSQLFICFVFLILFRRSYPIMLLHSLSFRVVEKFRKIIIVCRREVKNNWPPGVGVGVGGLRGVGKDLLSTRIAS